MNSPGGGISIPPDLKSCGTCLPSLLEDVTQKAEVSSAATPLKLDSAVSSAAAPLQLDSAVSSAAAPLQLDSAVSSAAAPLQ